MTSVGRSWRRVLSLVGLVTLGYVAGGASAPALAQGSTDWTSQNLNLDNNRFASLEEINAANVGRLTQRWSYEVGPRENISQATPLVVDGVMYLHSRSTLFALDAATGAERWTAVLDAGSPGAARSVGRPSPTAPSTPTAGPISTRWTPAPVDRSNPSETGACSRSSAARCR